MPYLKEYNCLFIHIPKTGGTSVEIYFMKKLNRILTDFDLYTDTDNNNYDHKYGKSYQHMTYKTIKQNNLFFNKIFNIDINKIDKIFTIVRNPYNRILSELVYRGYITMNTSREKIFEILKEYIYTNDTTYDNHIIPQCEFILDENNELNKNIKIMRTETLKENMIKYGFIDFNEYDNVTYGYKYNYLELLNENSIDLINEYYSKDFTILNYKKLNNNIKTNISSPQIKFISIANNEVKTKYLLDSAKLWNINIDIIKLTEWNGYIDKIIKVREYINNIPDDMIICFIDAYDTLLLSLEKDILSTFLNYNCNILFGSELKCYPTSNNKLYNMYYKTKKPITNYKYLNSGGYIGYKKYIYKMLQWKPNSDIISFCDNGGDQNYFTKYFLNNELIDKIKIDNEQKIFQNVSGVNINSFIFRNGHLYNTVLNTYPCIIHFNGFFDMDIKTVTNNDTKTEENVLELFFFKLKKSINGRVQTFNHNAPYYIIEQK